MDVTGANVVIGFVSAFGGTCLGAGIAYGVLKTKIDNLERQVTRLDQRVDTFEAECNGNRANCQSDIGKQLEEHGKKLTEIGESVAFIRGQMQSKSGEGR